MNNHSIDAMIYAWRAMKEKEDTMEYINFGKVVNVRTSVPTAIDDATYHIIIDFVPDDPNIFDDFRDNIDKILKRPDDYVLCNIEDIVKARKENQALKDRVKELEGQLADQKKASNKKLCEVYMETNATLYSGAYSLIAIGKELEDLKKQAEQMEELEKENQSLKVKNGDLFKERGVLQANLVKCGKERDYWKDRFGSVVIDVSKVLENNGVEFTMRSIDGNKWNVVIDIPELNEMKAKVTELERKLETAKSNETYWRKRKEEEEDHHYYWQHTCDRIIAQATLKGVYIDISGTDEDCNAGVVVAENMKAEELETKHDAKWSAMLQALKEKGVEVLYMGEEDGKPNIDIKIPEIGRLRRISDARAHQIDNLKKELDDLKSKTVAEARYEFKPGCLTLIFTMCDGSEQVFGMDSSEAIDATAISCGTVPKCKSCMNHRYFTNGGHYCHLPDLKFTIPGMFHIHSLTDEDAEGPACNKFVARKE